MTGPRLPNYRFPQAPAARVLCSAAYGRPRSFADDSQCALAGLTPPLWVCGAEHVPTSGRCLVTCNHYYLQGFPTWWLALAISSAVGIAREPGASRDLRRVMTAAWTYPDGRWRRALLTPATRWAFGRVARTYGFIAMPPMPPDPGEVYARAGAVLRAIRLARAVRPRAGMLTLAPEGQDVAGSLGRTPPGVGSLWPSWQPKAFRSCRSA